MSYATISSAMKTLIETVDGISGGDGKVNDFEPHVIRIEDYLTFFGNAAKTKINGWTISRESIPEEETDHGLRFVATNVMVVRGYFGLKNSIETEKDFQAIIDDLRAKVRGSTTIWAEHPELGSDQSAQTDEITWELHGSFLVHKCTIRFNVEEIFIVTP